MKPRNPKRPKTYSRVGLNRQHRIDWGEVLNLCCIKLARERYHGRVIAQATGLTVGQVYERLRQCNVKLRAERNGQGDHNRLIIRRYAIQTINKRDSLQLQHTIETPATKKANRKRKAI